MFVRAPRVMAIYRPRSKIRLSGCPILFTLTKEGNDFCEGWGFSFSFGLLLRSMQPFSYECPEPQVLSFRLP